MKTILNVLWFIFGGIVMAIGYFLLGVVLCVLIVTIPLGIQAFKLGSYAAWPYGRTVVDKPDAGTGSTIVNVFWVVLAGIWLAIAEVVAGVALCVTIIGIPFGIVHFKLARLVLAPFGKEIVATEIADMREATGLN